MDIRIIVGDKMKDNLKIIKKIFIITIFIILLIIFFSFLISNRDNKLINNIKKYIASDIKILYITDKNNYSRYPIELFKKYDINYVYINSTNLSNIEKNKMEKLINSKYLSNIIVIFEDGKIVDAIIEYESEDKLNEFLQKHQIIPEIIGDNSKIIPHITKLLEDEYTVLYLPYVKSEYIDSQNLILSEICLEYNIKYKMMDIYLLSKFQQEKLNFTIKYS